MGSLFVGLTLLLSAGCASHTNPPAAGGRGPRAYSGPELPAEQTAQLGSPLLYSIDGSNRDSAGVSYFGKVVSLLPGEHNLIFVVLPRQTLDHRGGNWQYAGTSRLWYAMKVAIEAGGSYGTTFRFIEPPGPLDPVIHPKRDLEDAELVLFNRKTGQRVGTGTRVKSPYE